ncbi:hypothetical protein [Bradyrhizobium jicamae]|nr:hypothetical protein [Bradyrhizobium jicamae]MBR0938097.1 hypothetical protein [Bradyrhizobium jicamae]
MADLLIQSASEFSDLILQPLETIRLGNCLRVIEVRDAAVEGVESVWRSS